MDYKASRNLRHGKNNGKCQTANHSRRQMAPMKILLGKAKTLKSLQQTSENILMDKCLIQLQPPVIQIATALPQRDLVSGVTGMSAVCWLVLHEGYMAESLGSLNRPSV